MFKTEVCGYDYDLDCVEGWNGYYNYNKDTKACNVCKNGFMYSGFTYT